MINKSNLIDLMSNKANMTRTRAEMVVNIIFNTMVKALMQDQRIEIRGFGTLANRKYKSYKGRNPRTGKSIDVKQKKVPFFKVGKELKKDLNITSTSSRSKNSSSKKVKK